MKDKSRILSSVIVSLLAGFIYFLVGENSPVNIQSSVKAILSNNNYDVEKYLTTECFSFNDITSKKDLRSAKNLSKFYLKKKNIIEFEYNLTKTSGEETFSDYVNDLQAKFKKPVADRNIDFTSELDKLVRVNKSNDEFGNQAFNPPLSCNEYEIADAERNYNRAKRLEKKLDKSTDEFFIKYNQGNGFEYNYLEEESGDVKSDCETKIFRNETSFSEVTFECKSVNSVKNNSCNTNKVIKINKIKVKAPELKINIRVFDEEDSESEHIEINEYDDCENDESM